MGTHLALGTVRERDTNSLQNHCVINTCFRCCLNQHLEETPLENIKYNYHILHTAHTAAAAAAAVTRANYRLLHPRPFLIYSLVKCLCGAARTTHLQIIVSAHTHTHEANRLHRVKRYRLRAIDQKSILNAFFVVRRRSVQIDS